jgi:hypothetical protein
MQLFHHVFHENADLPWGKTPSTSMLHGLSLSGANGASL